METQQWKSTNNEFHSDGWPSEVPDLIRRWAQARGYSDYQDFESFFSFKLKDLTDPMKLKDMEKAAERLIVAFQNKEKICLYADFDMDGTPGLALLLRGLRLCGFDSLSYFQPNRFEHGYGVHPEVVEGFIKECDVKLFVTIDVGITDVKAVETAKELGADFIITDHHQQKEILPAAHAIVNPNQKACDAGLEHLCGTGVAFYLVLALRRKMKEAGLLSKDFDPKSLLDCFAIGTVTDMVPMVKENRALVQHGLLELKKTPSRGLRHLMDELKLNQSFLSSQDVGIRLSPKLNALGRMNSQVQAIELFLVDDEDKAFQLVQEVLQSHQKRVDIQKQGEEIIEDYVRQLKNFNHLFLFSEHFHKGVVGLLATKLVNRFHVPALVGTVIDGKIVGSARAPDEQNILAGLEAAAGYLNKFGGHKQAAGFELAVDQAEPFAQALYQHFCQVTDGDQTPGQPYDFDCDLSQLNRDFLQWMKQLEPLGIGFEPPLLHLNNLFVASVKVLKDVHLKFVLKDIQGNTIEALWFFADDIEKQKKLTSKRVRVLAEPGRNEYMGKEKLQLLVRDLKVDGI